MSETPPTLQPAALKAHQPARPWYCFIYAIFGAHGTFWLFIISLIGAYATADDVAILLANLTPTRVEVADVVKGTTGLERWVQVRGLQLEISRELPLAGALPEDRSEAGPIGYAYDRILIDRSRLEAARWRWLLSELADVKRSVDQADGGGLEARHAWKIRFNKRIRPRLQPPEAGLFRPEVAMVVFQPGRRGQPPTPVDAAVPEAERELHQVLPLLDRVTPDRSVEGMLEPLPADIRKAYQERYGIQVAALGLRVGGRPSSTAVWVFGIFVGIIFFIVVGYIGILRTEGSVPEVPVDEADGALAPPPETP